MKKLLEPGLIKLFRYFSLIGLVYFIALWIYNDVSLVQAGITAFQSIYYVIIHVVLLIMLSVPWLERKLKEYYFPAIVISYTLAMVVGSWLYLLESNRGITHFISQSYSLVPILIVPGIFIAWQYDYRAVVVYTVLTNLSDLVISLFIVRHVSLDTLPILSLPIIRSFAVGLVGFLVSELNEKRKEQKHKLVLANIQLGQYANTLESLATSRERNRLARELHDTLAHTLSGISVNLEALKTCIPEGNEEVERMINSSLQAARRGLDGTRRALKDLRTKALEDLGLELALKALLDNLSERQDIEVEAQIEPLLHILPPNVEQAFYRIGQESIENVALHANASRIYFTLGEHDGIIEMIIADNGVGFDPESYPKIGHYGLEGIRERAMSIGADLTVESQIERGTTITLHWERMV
jgi:signal transduction histidine kinase